MNTAVQTPLSGREYIEELRKRRQARRAGVGTSSAPTIDRVNTPNPTPAPQVTQETTKQPNTPTASGSTQAKKTEEMFPGIEKPQPEETVFEWQAPSRPFKKRNRQYYTTIIAIVFLVSLILFFAGQFLPIAVVISVAFLGYVLSSVPPQTAVNKITTYGIRVEDQLYYWMEMGRFLFDKKYDQPLFHVEIGRFPGRLTLLIGDSSNDELREILSQVLLEEKPKPTFIDKAAQWIQEKIPLEVV